MSGSAGTGAEQIKGLTGAQKFIPIAHIYVTISMLKILIFIGMGSFLGGIARYGLTKVMTVIGGMPSFTGTMAANIIGCFLIGLLYGLFDRYNIMAEHWRMFLTVGFCGGFTTFSTFVHENYTHLTDGHIIQMILYATLSFAVGLFMVYLGHIVSR